MMRHIYCPCIDKKKFTVCAEVNEKRVLRKPLTVAHGKPPCKVTTQKSADGGQCGYLRIGK